MTCLPRSTLALTPFVEDPLLGQLNLESVSVVVMRYLLLFLPGSADNFLGGSGAVCGHHLLGASLSHAVDVAQADCRDQGENLLSTGYIRTDPCNTPKPIRKPHHQTKRQPRMTAFLRCSEKNLQVVSQGESRIASEPARDFTLRTRLQRMLELLTSVKLSKEATQDHLEYWVHDQGKVVLVGDAAHPMLVSVERPICLHFPHAGNRSTPWFRTHLWLSKMPLH